MVRKSHKERCTSLRAVLTKTGELVTQTVSLVRLNHSWETHYSSAQYCHTCIPSLVSVWKDNLNSPVRTELVAAGQNMAVKVLLSILF